jgi:hypothetical protein
MKPERISYLSNTIDQYENPNIKFVTCFTSHLPYSVCLVVIAVVRAVVTTS